MKKFTLLLCIVPFLSMGVYAQGQYKDVRQTYLWDVTLSMQGYNGSPDIYDKVVDVMVQDIESITNERTEVVVIPFQDTEYCEVWREPATEEGKAALIKRIRGFKTTKVTNTNLSAPLQYAIDNVFTEDKKDVLKLMTDGNDNVNPDRLRKVLSEWCEMAVKKDVYGYYILLTDAAKNGDMSLVLKEICNFEEVDASKMLESISQIRQVDHSLKKGLLINVRDEYNMPKRLLFKIYSGEGNIPEGFQIRFKTMDNEYIEIDEVAEIQDDNTLVIHPKFKKSQETLINELPTNYPYSDIVLTYEPTEEMKKGKYAFTYIIDKECAVLLENKPVKTLNIYVKK